MKEEEEARSCSPAEELVARTAGTDGSNTHLRQYEINE